MIDARRARISFVVAFVAINPSHLWALEPVAKPPAALIKKLESKRAIALRVMSRKFELIHNLLKAEKREDQARTRALSREIDVLEERYHPARELTQVVTAVKDAYQIRPVPTRGLIEGELREWHVEFNEALALAQSLRSDGVAARTSGYSGTSWFFAPAYESIPVLASYLVHEAVHFEQMVTWRSTEAIADQQQELEAYSAQLRHATHLGASKEEVRAIRAHAEAFLIPVVEWHYADIERRVAVRPLEPTLPVRYGKRIVAVSEPWERLSEMDVRSLDSPYWELRLRHERYWRILRLAVAQACLETAPAAAPEVHTDYSMERAYAASRYADDLVDLPGLRACEQYVLEDYLIGTGPVSRRDLVALVRQYRQKNGPWTSRLKAYGEYWVEELSQALPRIGTGSVPGK